MDDEADGLSGRGTKLTVERWNDSWNDKSTPLFYNSTNRALAALANIVHLIYGGLPLNRYSLKATF